VAATLVAVTTTLVTTGCSPHHRAANASSPAFDAELAAPTPTEPAGADCLTHAKVERLLGQLSTGLTDPRAVRLVAAACQKRVYRAGRNRFVFWDTAEAIQGKVTTKIVPLPSPRCIERGLALASEYAPFAGALLQRAAARDPALWRDPDVGAVAYLECEADEPTFMSIDTMLHETNHHLSPDKCIYDFATTGEICVELERGLPEGTLAAYAQPPSQLDADGAAWFAHLQQLYLVDNGHGLRNMLDEVMAYSITAEMLAVGAARRIYPKPGRSTFNNLPVMMAFTTRYLAAVAARDPALAARQFGATSKNRDAILAVLARAEAAYTTWLRAVRTPGVFERTFWDDYQRARAQWLQAPR